MKRLVLVLLLTLACVPAWAQTPASFYSFGWDALYGDVSGYLGEPFKSDAFYGEDYIYAAESALPVWPKPKESLFSGRLHYVEPVLEQPALVTYHFFKDKLYMRDYRFTMPDVSVADLRAFTVRLKAAVDMGLADAAYVEKTAELAPVDFAVLNRIDWQLAGRWNDALSYITLESAHFEDGRGEVTLRFYERGHFVSSRDLPNDDDAYWYVPPELETRQIMDGMVLRWGDSFEVMREFEGEPANDLLVADAVERWVYLDKTWFGYPMEVNFDFYGGLRSMAYVVPLKGISDADFLQLEHLLKLELAVWLGVEETRLKNRNSNDSDRAGQFYSISMWQNENTLAVMSSNMGSDPNYRDIFIILYDISNPQNAAEVKSYLNW